MSLQKRRQMRCVLIGWLLVALAATTSGCSKAVPSKPTTQKPAAFSELPVEITVKQRSTTSIPGSKLRLTIDDITRGQVTASIAETDGATALAAISLKEGESAAFTLDSDDYQLTLRELENDLIGDDFATFVISRGSDSAVDASSGDESTPPTADRTVQGENQAAGTTSERDKIERLLAAIENDEGATFIRNDAEHSGKEAAAHLRTKLKAAGNEVQTADDFIEKIANKSSLTDEPYRIRRADGSVVLASDYLREKLNAIQEEPPASE